MTDCFMIANLKDFIDLFQRWVKSSETRRLLYYETEDEYYFFIPTPDVKYCHIAKKSSLSKIIRIDFLSKAIKTLGYVEANNEDILKALEAIYNAK